MVEVSPMDIRFSTMHSNCVPSEEEGEEEGEVGIIHDSGGS